MRHPRRKRRIEHIEVERHIHRPLNLHPRQIDAARSHLTHFHAKFLRLSFLVRVQRPYPHLNQPSRQLLFHDSRKRASVRVRVIFIVFIEVGVRVEVNNRQPGMLSSNPSHQRIGHRMISAQK